MSQPSPHVVRLFTHPLDGQNILTLRQIFLNELPAATDSVMENDPTFDRVKEVAEGYGHAVVSELLNRLALSAVQIAEALNSPDQG